MTPTGKCCKFWAGNAWPRRALPCLDQGSIFRTLPRASRAKKIYLNPRSFNAAAIFGCVPVLVVENRVSATGQPRASCTTSATWCPGVRTTFTSCTRNINAPSARSSSTPTPPYALPKAHYTHRVVSIAVRLVVEDGLPYQSASWHLWRDHRVFVPYATIQNWVEAGGEKGGQPSGRHLSRLGSR